MKVELCDIFVTSFYFHHHKQQQDIQHITVFGKDAHHLLFLHCYQETEATLIRAQIRSHHCSKFQRDIKTVEIWFFQEFKVLKVRK